MSATVDFKNAPAWVQTNAQKDGDIFRELQVSKSRQSEVAGGSPGEPFAGVW